MCVSLLTMISGILVYGFSWCVQDNSNHDLAAKRANILSTVVKVASSEAVDPRCDALVAALTAHELSIRCISWHQQDYCSPCLAKRRAKWTLLEDGKGYIDESGTWMVYASHALSAGESADHKLSYPVEFRAAVGPYMLTWSADDNAGVFTQRSCHFSVGCTVWRAWGRCLDNDNQLEMRPLSELLRSAKTLEYLPPSFEEPWSGIRAESATVKIWNHLEARFDPLHQFAPRLIRRVRGHDNLVFEMMVVTQYQSVSGVDVPSVGVLGIYEPCPTGVSDTSITEEAKRDLKAATLFDGLPEAAHTADVALWLQRLCKGTLATNNAAAACPMGSITKDGWLACPIVFIADNIAVNKPETIDSLLSFVPDDAKVFNDEAGAYESGVEAKQLLKARHSQLNKIKSESAKGFRHTEPSR